MRAGTRTPVRAGAWRRAAEPVLELSDARSGAERAPGPTSLPGCRGLSEGMMRLLLAVATFVLVALVPGLRLVHAQSPARLEPERPAGWVFTPSLGFGGAWDDNVLLANPGDNPPGDYGTPINPSASLDYTGRRTRFSGGYNGSLVIYRTLHELNSVEQVVRALVEHRATRHVTIFAQENLTLAPTTDALVLSGVPFYRIGSRTNAAGGGLEAALTKYTSVRAAYTLRSVDFEVDEISASQLRGGHEHDAGVSLVRAFTSRFRLGAEYSFRRAIVFGREAAGGLEDRFNIQTGGMIMDYRPSPTVSLFGGLGVARLGAGLTHEERIAPDWHVGIAQRGRGSVVSASYRRSFIPSFGFGGTFQNEEWLGNVHVPFARNRAYVDGSVSWFDNEPLEAGQSNLRSVWMSGRMGYRATRWLRIEGFYNRAQQNAQRAGARLGRNQIGFQIVTSKPLPLR